MAMRFFEQQTQARAQTARLLVLFSITLVALLMAVNTALALMWFLLPFSGGYPAYFFTVNTAMTVLFVLGGWWLESAALSGGAAVLASRAGAREVRPSVHAAEQLLCNIVSELAIASSLPAPTPMVLARVYSINAFACGWTTHDAVVAVTQGALDHLSRDELQGLVAHEFSHIREGDTRLNMRLAGMVFGLEMIFNLGTTLCEKNEAGAYSILAIPGLAIKASGALGWLAGRALSAAVSRQREFLADARAVQFTRSKDGLGGVLRKVASQQGDPMHEPRAFHPCVKHMLLIGPDGGAHWFDSHPPLAERIRRIYGRPMPAMRLDDGAPTRPTGVF